MKVLKKIYFVFIAFFVLSWCTQAMEERSPRLFCLTLKNGESIYVLGTNHDISLEQGLSHDVINFIKGIAQNSIFYTEHANKAKDKDELGNALYEKIIQGGYGLEYNTVIKEIFSKESYLRDKCERHLSSSSEVIIHLGTDHQINAHQALFINEPYLSCIALFSLMCHMQHKIGLQDMEGDLKKIIWKDSAALEDNEFFEIVKNDEVMCSHIIKSSLEEITQYYEFEEETFVRIKNAERKAKASTYCEQPWNIFQEELIGSFPLNAKRNEIWAGVIKGKIKAGEKSIFIACGSNHLLGPDSFVKILISKMKKHNPVVSIKRISNNGVFIDVEEHIWNQK